MGLNNVCETRVRKVTDINTSEETELAERVPLLSPNPSVKSTGHAFASNSLPSCPETPREAQNTTTAFSNVICNPVTQQVNTFALGPAQYADTVRLMWPVVSQSWQGFPYLKAVFTATRASAMPNYLSVKAPVQSGLNIPRWRELLPDFFDTQLIDFLQFGWPLDFTAPLPPKPSYVNHENNPEFQKHIQDFITTESQLGAIAGPFHSPPFAPWTQVSPLLTRPKKGSHKRRVVVNLSFPEGRSVNDGITKGWYQGEPCPLHLPSISDLLKKVSEAGKGALLWSADLARAYRQLRVCPLSIPLLGITFEQKFYLDLAPPFGCRMSAMACARTTEAVVWLVRKQGFTIFCYLDDFVGVEKQETRAEAAYAELVSLTKDLGLHLASNKCVAPTTCLTWLGYEVNTIKMSVTIPTEKVDEVISICISWLDKTQATRSELKSLFGKLNHLASCILPASRFLARVLKALRDTPSEGTHALPTDLNKDLTWFIKCAKTLNGVQLLPPPQLQSWVIESDSSLTGGGAFSPSAYFAEEYGQEYLQSSTTIAHLEALNVIHALKYLLPTEPSKYLIIVNTDNQNTQTILESGTGRDLVITACARQLWWIAAAASCNVKIVYKPGKELILADALSRAHSDSNMKRKADELCIQKKLQRVRFRHSFDILDSDL